MTIENSAIYRELQEHLDKMPIGFPPTESGVELRILRYLFSPEEAEIATMLNFMPESLKVIMILLLLFSLFIKINEIDIYLQPKI